MARKKLGANNYIWKYITDLTRLMPEKSVFVLVLMVIVSLTEGIGLLLLVPLLQLVGLDVQQGALGQIAGYVSLFFSYIGIKPTLGIVLVIYVIIISLNALFYKVQTLKSSEIQYEFAAYLRKRLFNSVTGSNWLFFTQKRSSDFAHALTYEIERIGVGTNQFLSLIASIFVLAVYLIFALELSGLITGLIFLVGIILLLLLKRRTSSAQRSGEALSDTSKNMYSSTIQHLDGMKTIKSFNMEEKNIETFGNVADRVAGKYIDAVNSYADVRFLFDVGSVIILSIIVFILISFMNLSISELLILLFLFVRMIPRFSIIQRSYQYFINMIPAFVTIMDLEKECEKASEPKLKTGKVKLEDEIKFENVSFSYDSSDESFSLKNLNLTIKAGQTSAVVGLSGAGKSTIADMVMGLINPVNGHILIDNKVLSEDNLSAWRSQIGYVAQDTFLFNDTVRNNLLLAKQNAAEEEIITALKLASADEFVLKLPGGLDTLIGDRGVLLSGGERQRLALARALLREPSLLILDEATSNLDSKNEKKIMGSIEKLHGNITILVIAHRLSTIRSADSIYLIESGNLIEFGTWDSLLGKEKGYFKSLYELQS
ncbi:ABC transporter ATP-binding protein [Methanobacterium veterum]|uniref:ABC transporter ATP-binding protein n=2 Tax=Methanobacterium TaxID=2160 RepID=A0A9E5DJ39_9EURY|nr:ABC transporter ATP-binding protein [Methanobacterium veterum]MCZ3367526.1 ABC transporter ATP-binding protein [Methanobacterium veterum]MCZ3373326.1 ABC transporter ATP-binding protein [Methanobacterium veterum]